MDASKDEIKRSLAVLFQPGDTIELRCVGNRTISGFYRNQDTLADATYQLNSTFKPLENCYVCLNPVQPALYGRRAEQFAICKRGEAVRDTDVACRRWLLIDIDPVRPTGVSATDQQKQAAIDLAKQVYAWLVDQLGSSSIVCCDSGNGAHMLIRLPDLPADEQTRWTCEHFLQMLAERFSTEQAKVDQTTFNAARICTLYGTVKRKGSSIPSQPHRLSRLLHVPDPLEPVNWQQLVALVEPYPGLQVAAQQPAGQAIAGNGAAVDIDQVLAQQGAEHSRDDCYQTASGEQATRWQLEQCPWEPEHQGSAWIIRFPSGAIAAGCLGDRCAGKSWADLRQLWQLPSADDGLQAAVLASLQQHQAAQPQPALQLPDYISPPDNPQGAFYGPLGQLVLTYAPQTEASPIAMLACLLTYYGNALGRRYYSELDGRQYPKLFTCLLGRTAKGRKFTADQNACRMLDAITPTAELFRHTGLSTGEGLIKTLLDHKDGMLPCPAVFQEGEFASVIKRKERKGNSLDDVLRNAWDDVALGTTTRADPLRAVGSHVSLVVHVTPDELKRLLSSSDLTSGFGNRFLWIHSNRSQRKSDARGFQPSMATQQLAGLQATFQQLCDQYQQQCQPGESLELPLTAEAAAAWQRIYDQLDGDDGDDDSGLLPDLCARLPAYLRRIALIYSLADGSQAVTPEHLQAAWAVCEYSRDTLDYVYSQVSWADLNNQQELIEQRAAKYLRVTTPGQELPRWKVLHQVYQRHRTAKELNQIRDYLIRCGQLAVRDQQGAEVWQRPS